MVIDKHTHDTIARGLRQGDRDAWLKLYEAYAQSIWRNVGRLMCSDATSVADVVQETFISAARSARNFDARRGSLWVWLWTIAQRQVALYYRKQRPAVSLDQARQWWSSLDGEKTQMIRHMQAPPELLESQELAALVRHCLAQLSPEYQALLMAKYVDDMSADQIAGMFNRSTVAVRSKLARARRAFRRLFLNAARGDFERVR
jgi:RNA polymerase sigma-70 factor (ECF subfamily)